MISLRYTATIGLILALPAAALAQTAEKRITWSVGSGSVVTLSDTRDRFGNGVAVIGGVAYAATDRVDLSFDYGISWHNVKGAFFDLPSLRGDQRMQQFAFNATYWLNDRHSTVAFFVVGGPGIFRRDVSITYISGTTGPVCDPFLLVCEEDPEENLVGSRGSTDAGVSFGGGFTFPLTDYLRMSVDTRYLFIWGPKIDTSIVPGATSSSTTANGQFLPVRIVFLF